MNLRPRVMRDKVNLNVFCLFVKNLLFSHFESLTESWFFLLKLKYNMKFNSGRRNKATTKFKNFLMFQTLHCHKKHQPRLMRNKVNVECVNLIFLSNLCRYIKKSSMIRTFYFFNTHTCYFRFIYNIIYVSLKTFWIFQHNLIVVIYDTTLSHETSIWYKPLNIEKPFL